MAKKKTTEEFIAQAVAIHGDKYSYEHVVYKAVNEKVLISCPIHKTWLTTPGSHLTGRGCPECGKITAHSKTRKSEEQVREAIRAVHGDTYLYKDVLGYKNKESKIDIFCKKHGWFKQTVSNHVHSKTICKECAHEINGQNCRKTGEEFIKDADRVHSGRYDYSRVKYETTHKKVEIYCTKHGFFWQEPSSHLAGRGCPDCAVAGYKNSLPGKLYVLTERDLVKVGITNFDAKERCQSVSRESGKTFNILKEYVFDEGFIPRAIETEILRELRSQHKQPQERFDGSTECFYDVHLASPLNRIEELIAAQTKEQDSSNQLNNTNIT
jgi:predicted  nucleic acid-binding Zn-ribbon protein